jgi:hypothetical protein
MYEKDMDIPLEILWRKMRDIPGLLSSSRASSTINFIIEASTNGVIG